MQAVGFGRLTKCKAGIVGLLDWRDRVSDAMTTEDPFRRMVFVNDAIPSKEGRPSIFRT